MEKIVQTIFLYEILRQCRLVLQAFSDLENIINEPDEKLPKMPNNPSREYLKQRGEMNLKKDDKERKNADRCWIYIQAILTLSANISKILWHERDKKPKLSIEYFLRGIQLRHTLNIDKNWLLHDRDLRNHSEHYDERIHEWASKSKGGMYSHNMGIDGSSKDDPYHDMFNFDPLNYTVSFWGKKYDIRAIVKEIEILYEKVQKLPPYGSSI
jgi:hypothetical protein